jgi:hypothetical protein
MLTTTLAELQKSLSGDYYAMVTQCIGGPERWGTGPIPLNVLLLPHLGDNSHQGDEWVGDVLEIGEVVRILTALGHGELVHTWLCDCLERADNIVGERAASVADIVRCARDIGGSGPTTECLGTLDLMIAADCLTTWDHEASISYAMNAVHIIDGDNGFRYWCAARLCAYLDEEV